jgi:hypothetical protein
MVTETIGGEVTKAALSLEFRKELVKHGLWAILFTALLSFVLWSSQRREERLMLHQERIQTTQQQIVDEQRRLSEAITRIDGKMDKLIDRQ